MTQAVEPEPSGLDDDRARRSGEGEAFDLVFIHGFQDTAALWQEVKPPPPGSVSSSEHRS